MEQNNCGNSHCKYAIRGFDRHSPFDVAIAIAAVLFFVLLLCWFFENIRRMYQKMTSSVLNGDIMVRNRIFWTIGEHLYFVYYPSISYQWINVYRVERMEKRNISLTR